MGIVYFNCPTEARPIDSGIYMDEESYRQKRLQIASVYCLWCNRMHRFLLADATFNPPVDQYPPLAE